MAELFRRSRADADYRGQWLSLVLLTVVSGLLPVTLPTINVSISISETFVIAGTLLFGRSGGTVLVVLDALFISAYLFWSRGLRWQQIVFNLAAPPLSIWVAATLAGIEAQFQTDPKIDTVFTLRLTAFTTLYFLLNSWLISLALALQRRAKATTIWWNHFFELLVNYGAGGSIAALLVYNTREVKPQFVFAIVPLLVLLFLNYRWSNRRIEVERERANELNRVFRQQWRPWLGESTQRTRSPMDTSDASSVTRWHSPMPLGSRTRGSSMRSAQPPCSTTPEACRPR